MRFRNIGEVNWTAAGVEDDTYFHIVQFVNAIKKDTVKDVLKSKVDPLSNCKKK